MNVDRILLKVMGIMFLVLLFLTVFCQKSNGIEITKFKKEIQIITKTENIWVKKFDTWILTGSNYSIYAMVDSSGDILNLSFQSAEKMVVTAFVFKFFKRFYLSNDITLYHLRESLKSLGDEKKNILSFVKDIRVQLYYFSGNYNIVIYRNY